MERTFLLFVVVSVYISCVYGGGTIKVQLVRYENPGGKDINGTCCESFRKTNCPGACDHMFTLCMDDVMGDNFNMSQCLYGTTKTGVVWNINEILFGQTIGGTTFKNPMTFAFSSWPGLAKLKVKVEDYDTFGSNDLVDYFQTDFMIVTPELRNSTANANVKAKTLGKTTRLDILVRVICDENFYGFKCEKFCEENKHNTCDRKTGDVICKTGWTGDNCNEKRKSIK